MLISEQQKFYTERELLQLGYQALPIPPSDYSSTTYFRQRAGNPKKTYYKKRDNSQIDQSTVQDLSKYEGTYTSLGKTGKIILDGQTLRASLGPINSALEYVADDNFTFKTNLGSGKLTFTKDSTNKIDGFDYKFGDYSGTAIKVVGSTNTNPSTPDNKKNDSSSNPKSTTTPPPPAEPVKTIDYKIKYPAAQDPTKPFNSIPCDEKVYNWDYGCKNNKIGLMNTILFGDEYGKIYGPELLTKLRNIRYLGPQETKITEDIYNKVLKLGEEQGSVKLQETIVKQTVKNILKERLIKK
jgi:hypothetical protein